MVSFASIWVNINNKKNFNHYVLLGSYMCRHLLSTRVKLEITNFCFVFNISCWLFKIVSLKRVRLQEFKVNKLKMNRKNLLLTGMPGIVQNYKIV